MDNEEQNLKNLNVKDVVIILNPEDAYFTPEEDA